MPDETKTTGAPTVATKIGPTVAPATGVPQTTIDSKTTTILPNTSITNPVEPDGQPAPEHIKRAVVGQQPVVVAAAPLKTVVAKKP